MPDLIDNSSRPLVFVVGAGASKDFGVSMPIGSELAEGIERQLRSEFTNGSSGGPIKSALMRTSGGLTPRDIESANRIRRSIFVQASIDDLLNEWREIPEMIRVGKIAIANELLSAERNSKLGVTAKGDTDEAYDAISGLRDCWLTFLLKNLRNGTNRRDVEKIFENVAFVVFNYDRCIEQYLYWAFQSVGGLTAEAAAQAAKRIPIVHVYGDLGALPFDAGQSLDVSFGSSGIIYEHIFNRIKTYTEEDLDKKNLKKIHSLIRNAKRIVFLGMGYHHRNIDLLMSGGPIGIDCDIWGTSLNPDQVKLQMVQSKFGNNARLDSFSCTEFLRMNREMILEIY